MKIKFRGKNTWVTEAMEIQISKKLSKLDKYFILSDNVEARVLAKIYPRGQKLEVTIPTEHVLLRAEAEHDDLYVAIDLIVEKLERQIRKYKTRLSKASKGDKLAFNTTVLSDVSEQEDEDIVVRTKSINPKPMDLEEAIMQMELIGHSFFVYRDNENNLINVVYRRNDGDYGLIETE
jgi:ribosomal subunit interface protein